MNVNMLLLSHSFPSSLPLSLSSGLPVSEHFLNSYPSTTPRASKDSLPLNHLVYSLQNQHLGAHCWPPESGSPENTVFLTRSPSHVHVHRSLRTTSLTYREHKGRGTTPPCLSHSVSYNSCRGCQIQQRSTRRPITSVSRPICILPWLTF